MLPRTAEKHQSVEKALRASNVKPIQLHLEGKRRNLRKGGRKYGWGKVKKSGVGWHDKNEKREACV